MRCGGVTGVATAGFCPIVVGSIALDVIGKLDVDRVLLKRLRDIAHAEHGCARCRPIHAHAAMPMCTTNDAAMIVASRRSK